MILKIVKITYFIWYVFSQNAKKSATSQFDCYCLLFYFREIKHVEFTHLENEHGVWEVVHFDRKHPALSQLIPIGECK